jgi:hypothetical protein
MKKFLSLVALVCMTMTMYAQSNNIQLYVYTPEQAEEIPEASVDYLVNGLCTAVTADGLAAQTDYMTQFLLLPKVNVATKNVLANTQQQVVLTLDVSLQVVDNISGTIYASKTINLKGVGTNETKAYNAAFRTLSKNHQQIKSLVSTAKQKILAYFEAESENIIKKANLLATQEKYDEAFYLLSMIPSQCSKYELSISAGLTIWNNYKDFSCSKNLAKAQSVWDSGQNNDAAIIAGMYLSRILPDASCYGDAQQLYKDIKDKVGDLWKFEMSVYKDDHELRMAKVKAMQEIGVAYGKGQQPKMLINKSLF